MLATFKQFASLLWVIAFSTKAAEQLRLVVPSTSSPPKPLPFAIGPSASDLQKTAIDIDSKSMLLNGTRWIPIAGEMHYARAPPAQWRETLLRMRAGGLNMVSTYVFWIHHEEQEGTFVFSGRRDLRRFLKVAADVGMMVHIRVGPWDHGDVRNGGHPDWIIKRAKEEGFKLRSNSSRYMWYVSRLYSQLSEQLNDLWWSNGGPLVFCQLENESADWHYLLALRSLALSFGFAPVAFTKTGWPAPSPGYQNSTPLLPLYSGYPDYFWVDSMQPSPLTGDYTNPYLFGNVQKPAGFGLASLADRLPILHVEDGGGMGSDYNHRVHMANEDMPSMHLVAVGAGVNGLGYYMYSAGSNPASLDKSCPDTDPACTLQESTFGPDPGNGEPSVFYDYFSPLGDVGQPRRHYHQMRQLHLMATDFGKELAAAASSTPPLVLPSGPNDTTTLRWNVRSASDGSGFIFVNNHERLQQLSAHDNVTFQLEFNMSSKIWHGSSNATLQIPSDLSRPLHVKSGVWFAWPFSLPVSQSGCAAAACQLTLAWATAQLVARVPIDDVTDAVVFVASEGISPEFAIISHSGVLLTHTCRHCTKSPTIDGLGRPVIIVKQLDDMTWLHDPAATVVVAASDGSDSLGKLPTKTVHFFVLPSNRAEGVWRGKFAGQERLFVTDPAEGVDTLLIAEGGALHLRSQSATMHFAMLPPINQQSGMLKTANGLSVMPSTEGRLFSTYSVPMPVSQSPKVDLKLIKAGGPPRTLHKALSGKAQEPTAKDWEGAATWQMVIDPPKCPPASTELRLLLRYFGDCARLYATTATATHLLTDNFFSGYRNDGAMVAGLSYLASEYGHEMIFGTTANLSLSVLPMNRTWLLDDIFLRSDVQPPFDNNGVAMGIESVEVIQVFSTTLMFPLQEEQYI